MHVLAPTAEDVILRDGSTLRLRPPGAADAAAVAHFFEALSDRSRYLRFHGFSPVRADLIARFLDPDWIDRGALIGTTADAGVVALASWARLRDPATAEVAFVVADAYQGRGIGTRLLERLAAHAAAAGIAEFVAEVIPENRAMLRVFEDAGFSLARELGGGVIEIRFPIAATEDFRTRVEARDHAAVVASLQPFFEPASIAVVGASPRRGTIGGELFRNVLTGDFTGAAYPVNRGGVAVAGVRGYGSVGEIPDRIDLAVISVPGEHVLAAAEDALNAGVRALCVISAGFAELGAEGAERQERLLALVRAHGARLVGPNCLGIAVTSRRLNATFGRRALPPGNVAFSSQSGALGIALLEKADERGLGLSAFVSVGNKADVSSNDLLEWWEDDPQTDVVLLYLESFGNPRKFARIAQRVAQRKPILAMRSGTTRSGARAAGSHTAALAASDVAVDALFRQAGVLRARTLGELIDAAAVLSRQPPLAGPRTAILTNAGGLGILCADACEAAGLELPELGEETVGALRQLLPAEASVANPIDMLGSATAETYEAALPLLLADARVDAVIVLFVPPVVATAEQVAAALARATAGAAKPVLPVVLSAEGTPPGSFAYPESAAAALGLAAQRSAWLRRPLGTRTELEGIDRDAAHALVDRAEGWLEQRETRALLEAYGIPLVGERVAASPDDAAAAARELGFPAVVKSAAAGVHKTESGGVALDLRDEEQVRAAADRIGCPVIVQPLVRGGVELLTGVVQDPLFGPLVAFGPGGVLAELIGEASFRIAPLTDVDAAELVHTGKAGRLIAGYRGAPPADATALEDLVLRLAALGDDLPEIAELDLNPVLALPDGCVAVDARVRVQRPEATRAAKTW